MRTIIGLITLILFCSCSNEPTLYEKEQNRKKFEERYEGKVLKKLSIIRSDIGRSSMIVMIFENNDTLCIKSMDTELNNKIIRDIENGR